MLSSHKYLTTLTQTCRAGILREMGSCQAIAELYNKNSVLIEDKV